MKQYDLRYSITLFVMLFIWLAITSTFSLWNILLGFVISIISLEATDRLLGISYSNLFSKSLIPILKLNLFVFIEIYRSSYILIKKIITNDLHVTSVEYDMKLEKSFERTLLANTVTLIPGAITVGQNNNTLLVISPEKDTNLIHKDISTIENKLQAIEVEK